jgi:hypothetical protein
MARLIVPGTPGREVLVPQRLVEDAPFTNCAVIDNTRQAIRSGLAFPSLRRWVRVFREATGVPEISPTTGGTLGTRASERMRAWSILAPWYPIRFEGWDTQTLWDAIDQGQIDGSLTIQYGLLPDQQRRWSPRFTGGHQIGLVRARKAPNEPREVRIVDPLGLDPYTGDWVAWGRIMDAAPTSFAGGKLYLQTMEPGASGMSISITPREVTPAGTKVKVPKGTRTYAYDPKLHNLVAKPVTTGAQTRATDGLMQVQNAPAPRSPTGAFYHIIDGTTLAGRYVRAGDVTLIPQTAPADCEARIEQAVNAAVTPLQQEIKAQEAAMSAAVLALQEAI